MWIKYSWVALLCVIVFGCKKKDNHDKVLIIIVDTTTHHISQDVKRIAFYDTVLQSKQIGHAYEMKYEASIPMNDNEMTVVGQIKIVRDSAIQITFGMGFGIELGRAFIRHDSFFIVNRLSSECTVGQISKIANEFGLPFSYADIQSILLHEAYVPSDLNYKQEKQTADTLNDVFISKDANLNLKFSFLGKRIAQNLLSRYFSDTKNGFKGRISYSAMLVYDVTFPSQININFSTKSGVKNSDINIKSMFIRPQLSLNFRIPQNMKIIQR